MALGAFAATDAPAAFRAGAYAIDVTPTSFPVTVNGGFLSKTADRAHDPLHARWLVLDDGRERVALGVVDTCLIPAEYADAVKARARELTGLPPDRIMLSATHTHSAPSLMPSLGTPPDPEYAAFALPLIAEGLRRAVDRLAPARVGWAVVPAPDHTHTRVWIRRPDRMLPDPFGALTVRANMHPGYESPDVVGPSGPSDPALTLLAVRSPTGRPLAVLANYSMHYFGAPAVSADYFGAFAEALGKRLGATNAEPAFVGIMSQGTSGDQHWMDYGRPRRDVGLKAYAAELARLAAEACATVDFRDRAPVVMRERTLRLATRQPDEARLAWARGVVEAMGDRPPKSQAEVYAREQIWLKENPSRDVKLQALRVGELGIAMWPCEVFALTGLKLKALSPLPPTMNLELANGEEGYIPPPELFPLGGYNTWACRTAGLETNAEPLLVDALLGLLEDVSGRRRREVRVTHGPYARAILAARPLAYWRLEEWGGAVAADATGARRHAAYEPGVARWLEGPASPAFSGPDAVNRAPHFAGGRLGATLSPLGPAWTAELWFWNGLPVTARPVTGELIARGTDVLALGGVGPAAGRLVFGPLVGRASVAPRTWHHLALVRDGARVRAHLDGNPDPDFQGEVPAVLGEGPARIRIGGGPDAGFEGRMDEIAVYGRALSAEEIRRHVQLAGVSP